MNVEFGGEEHEAAIAKILAAAKAAGKIAAIFCMSESSLQLFAVLVREVG
jgi:4-hydroxy-2-oxoheptanedioate aldolase